MSTLSKETLTALKGRIRAYTHDDAEAGVTLESVIMYSLIGAAAVVVAGIIVAAIMAFAANIPAG